MTCDQPWLTPDQMHFAGIFNGNIPSLREALIIAMGLKYDNVQILRDKGINKGKFNDSH